MEFQRILELKVKIQYHLHSILRNVAQFLDLVFADFWHLDLTGAWRDLKILYPLLPVCLVWCIELKLMLWVIPIFLGIENSIRVTFSSLLI